MSKVSHQNNTRLPLIIEKDEAGFYVAECPLFDGCYSQGKTLDEAITNVREAIQLALEEKQNQNTFSSYQPRELSLHTIAV